MTVKNSKPSNQAEIRRLMDNWAEAIRSKDVNEVMSQYAPDIEAFDLAPPLQYRGADAYRKNWEGWFPTFRGSIGYEIRDLTISASDDIAFCHSFNRITGTRTDNERPMSGYAPLFAFVRSAANGRSCMSINRYRFTWDEGRRDRGALAVRARGFWSQARRSSAFARWESGARSSRGSGRLVARCRFRTPPNDYRV